jgi:hypothetical protein
MQEVVGLGVERPQPPLQLQLARAALLLGALHLYRFCFVVGCLVVRPCCTTFISWLHAS